MDILQIVAVGIIGAIISIMLKQYKSEYAIISALATSAIILFSTFGMLDDILSNVYEIATTYNISTKYIGTVIKIIAISYICQFSAEICRDSGQGAIASKIEFCAKILILLYSLPIAEALLSLVVSILP